MARSDKIELSEKDIQQLEIMSGLGVKVSEMAAIIGMSKKTLERRIAEDFVISDALEKGRAKANTKVTESLYRMAVSGKHPSATFFWMKCRCNWSELGMDEKAQNITINYIEKK